MSDKKIKRTKISNHCLLLPAISAETEKILKHAWNPNLFNAVNARPV